MKNRWMKAISLAAAASMAVLALAGCGTAGGSGSNGGASSQKAETVTFSYLIDGGVMDTMYETYGENPIYKYWSAMEWNVDGAPKKLALDFVELPAGTESDTLTTLIATKEYADVVSTTYSTSGVLELYEEGIAQDMTEYVEKYMPNYMAWVNEHPQMKNVIYNHIDGEDKILQLYALADKTPEMWGGFDYRRDWIVKYGKNPETGAAFSGEWKDTEYGSNWEDDVVFPSGNTDPVTITDWEWMLEIFAEAIEDQNLEGGYPFSLSYQGYYEYSDLVASFGIGVDYYVDEDGLVQFGGDSDAFRAYLECMNTWYENGWVDPAFDERPNDMFFMINDEAVYGGKVGLWYGVSSQLGDVMDVSGGDESNPTNGIVVFGAAQPINDKYGDADCQNKTPSAFYSNSLLGTGIIITDKAKDKDIPTLLTALDYLYSQEGGLLRSYGFSDVQQAEIQDPFYTAHHLDRGAYDITKNDAGEEIYNLHNETYAEENLAFAAMMNRVVGKTVAKNVNHNYPAFKQNSVDQYVLYPNTGYIDTPVLSQLTASQSKEKADSDAQRTTYMAQAAADFVTGRTDISDDAEWESYTKELAQFGEEEIVGYFNEALGN